jgi:four helix bundle protein
MALTNFEKLRVYKLSEDLADEIWSIVLKWPLLARDTVGKQIIRSADSVGANIAEGTGRWAWKDNQRLVRTARGSLHETRHWLRRAFKRNLLSDSQIKKLRPIVDNLSPMLNAYLKSIARVAHAKPRQLRQRPATNY